MSRRCVVTVLAILSLSMFVGPAWAGLNTWSGGGPTGAAIRAVLVDPITQSTIYVGTIGSGVFKSIDNGTNWAQSDPTGPIATRTVRSIVAGAPGTLYAGADNAVDSTSGVFQSTDSGATWTALSAQPANRKVQALAWDGTILYAGTREEGNPVVTGGVFKWDGTSWTPINGTPPNNLPTQSSRRVQALAINPGAVPPVVYAGTQGDGVFKSVDRGVSWTRINGVPSPNQGFHSDCLDKPEILSLAFDTNALVETLYAGAMGDISTGGCTPTPPNGQGAGFFLYTATSGQWNRRMNGLLAVAPTFTLNVWAIVLNPLVSPTRIFIGTDEGVFTSNDQSGSWDGIPQIPNATGFIGLPIRAVGIDTSGGTTTTVYAGSGGRGMFKRTFPLGELPWTLTNAGLTAIRAQAAAVGSRGGSKAVFAGLVSGGIVTSIDNGASWQDTSETSLSVRGIATDPTTPSIVYAATGKGVIKSVNGGDSWSPASTGLPTTTSQDPTDLTPFRTVRSIVVDPADPVTLYAAVGGVFRSEDGGATWTSVNGNLPAAVTAGDGTVSALVIDYVSAGVNPNWGNLYAATDGSGVFKSADGGVTWVLVPGMPAPDLFVAALAFDPLGQLGPTLYAGTSTGKVFKSVNGGSSTSLSTGLPGQAVSALAVRLGAPSKVYAGLNGGGVYSIAANATTWTSMNAGLLSLNVAGLGFDPELPGTLHAATLGRGMFDFEIDNGFSPPFVSITSHPPPGPYTTGTSPIQLSGSASSGSNVFWSTNRGHAGPVTSGWNASVLLELGPNVITVTAVDSSFNQGSVSVEVTLEQSDPVIFVSPTSLPFGTVAVGGKSSLQSVTVRNDGTASLILGTITRGGANPSQFKIAAQNDLCSGATLAPTQTCTVGLKFWPTSTGAQSATLLIPSNDPVTSLVTVTLSGTGSAAGPEITVTPTALAFGTVAVGSKSSLQSVTVRNDGTASLILGTITRGGANPGEFKLAAQNDLCSGVTLAPTQTCTVGLKFWPTSTGARSATLLIPSNDPDEATVIVPLTGTGQ